MILAFPAWRRGYFKTTGSVIDAALRHGHDVRLLWHEAPGKPGEDVSVHEIAQCWPTVPVEHLDPAIALVDHPGPPRAASAPSYVLIGPSLHAIGGLPSAARCSLDYAWEQITAPAAAFDRGAHLCYGTEHQRQMHERLLGLDITTGFHPIAARQHVTGSTMLDAFALVRPDDVRARYCLPAGQPVVLFLALKFRVPHVWRRWWYRYTGYHRLVRAVRRYCDAAGALLVIKTRAKNLDPWFLRHYADRYIGDDDLWPHTSARLLRVASLCIHFQSGAAIEAACAEVPQLSVRVPQPHLARYPGHAEVYGPVGTLQRWPGVVMSTDYTAFAREPDPGPEMYPQELRVDAEARRAYLARFCGPRDAGERVVALIEREARRW